MVIVVPVPCVTVLAGASVKVQVPVTGKPATTTLPVGVSKVGWVIRPINGVVGVPGADGITTLADGGDTQPELFVTVYV